MNPVLDRGATLRFLRHGATAANLLGLRCGGDLDLPLAEVGRRQAVEAAQRIAALHPPVHLIVTSDLKRTRETAQIVAHALGGAAIVVEPDFAERSLGEWNLRSVDGTQSWLDRGLTPPGGETSGMFADRIARAAHRLISGVPDLPLLVGSKGVARVLGELASLPAPLNLENAALAEFDLGSFFVPATARRMS
jgi:probable phosphoglycerate mutase